MRTLAYVVIFLLILPSTSFANISASVVSFKGEVLYNGQQITKDTKFLEDGLIEVNASSYLKILVEEYNSEFSLGPKSSMRVNFKKDINNSPYTFINGLLRWVTKGKSKVKGFIRTDSSSLAVRGTDFLIVVSELLGETEVYCFSGQVLFQNRKDRNDKGLIKKNDWGGIGGRFSPKLGKLVPMSEKQIKHVKSLLE
ncbi:MAG: hypothetical protein HN576_16220 [Bacteriovoracaceae bacterium]|jgi:hypothetical protein|nr:hypothetical protein [Bacteriovoracaceae bacterium]